jgi:type II secretory pathway pseudopilin PulG
VRPLRSRSVSARRRGFALLGLLAVVGVVLALAGLLLPTTFSRLAGERVARTAADLDLLERSVHHYAEDTLSLPESLRDLLEPACAPRGWAGPYLDEPFDAAPPGFPLRADADAFGALVGWTLLDPTLGELRSAGPNGIEHDGDDLARRVDLRPFLRTESLRRIAVINGAIRRFLRSEDADHLWDPGDLYPEVLSALRARNYLDGDSAWDADAWGSPFVADGSGTAGADGNNGKALGHYKDNAQGLAKGHDKDPPGEVAILLTGVTSSHL